MEALELSRPLTPLERGLWKLDLASPLNFTTVAKVRGPLDEQRLRAALPALAARHPHLRERIEDGAFVTANVPPLELEVTGVPWVEAVDAQLRKPVTAPLARFVRAGERLLVTLHHAVGDGMSGVYLMRDWLRAAAGEALEPLHDPGGADALLPEVPLRSTQARFLGRELWLTARYGRPVKLRADQPCFAYDRRPRLEPRVLEPELVTRLRERARKEQTTVHGALSAAMLLALLADAERTRGAVQFGSPVNVRAKLTARPGEGLGFYVSMVAFRAAVHGGTPLWELARAVRRDLEAELARKTDLAALKMVPSAFALIRGETLTPRALAERWERTLPTTTGLTNLGPLDVETKHGALELEECHFAAAPSALGDFLATATSLHGRLFWNFIWTEPLLTAPHARALIDAMVARVHSAI